MLANDLLGGTGHTPIHLLVCAFLPAEGIIALSQVCRSLRSTVRSSSRIQIRIAVYMFLHPLDLDLVDMAPREPREALIEYTRRRIAQLNLVPSGCDFENISVGPSWPCLWRSGSFLTEHTSIGEMIPWITEDWDGELEFELCQIGRLHPKLLFHCVNRTRFRIPGHFALAKAWDTAQDVFAMMTHHVASRKRAYFIFRFYSLFRRTAQNPMAAAKHGKSKYELYRLQDQSPIEWIKVMLGPGGILCFFLRDAVVFLDWQQGVWLGKHLCSPKDAILLDDGTVGVLCFTPGASCLEMDVLDPRQNGSARAEPRHSPDAEFADLAHVKLIAVDYIDIGDEPTANIVRASFLARADAGRTPGDCAIGLAIQLAQTEFRPSTIQIGLLHHRSRDRGKKSKILLLLCRDWRRNYFKAIGFYIVAGSAIYRIPRKDSSFCIRMYTPDREYNRIAAYLRNMPQNASCGLQLKESVFVPPEGELVREGLSRELEVFLEPKDPSEPESWHPIVLHAGDGCLIMPMVIRSGPGGMGLGGMGQPQYEKRPVVIIPF